MKEKWKISALIGFAASLLTFIFSLMNNTWLTSLIRSFTGFLCFFVLGFVFQMGLKQIFTMKNGDKIRDLFPIEDAEMHELLQNQAKEGAVSDSSFQAVSLHSLHNGADAAPEIIAETIRTWTSQNQEG